MRWFGRSMDGWMFMDNLAYSMDEWMFMGNVTYNMDECMIWHITMVAGTSNFELNLLKLKTSWNYVNVHNWKVISIPTITMQWDFTLYYIPIQILIFTFVLVWFCFLNYSFLSSTCVWVLTHEIFNVWISLSECTLHIICGELKVFHFGASNSHY
jgi:hypothetical protein